MNSKIIHVPSIFLSREQLCELQFNFGLRLSGERRGGAEGRGRYPRHPFGPPMNSEVNGRSPELLAIPSIRSTCLTMSFQTCHAFLSFSMHVLLISRNSVKSLLPYYTVMSTPSAYNNVKFQRF